MSEIMRPIRFRELVQWAAAEHSRTGGVFGVARPYRAGQGKSLPIFGEHIETPFGPAAGPNTQLAQNIVAAYFAGARFFELKTVQKMDGAELAACISRPCILAEDECYNCEWSTELTVPQAFDEYVKAWCALKLFSRLWGLGDPDGFVFNLSVGYDLEGIQGEKIDRFLEGMKDASGTSIFKECLSTLEQLFPGEAAYIQNISPHVSRSVTLSTLHGCPPDEIERIASYLITEKHLHTFVKCNPTILGYDTARSILDGMGWDYVSFDDHHFREDLQYADAVPMFRRLQTLADREGVEFGLKLSNTFPVEVRRNELPSEEMYMAGRALYPLTVTMAANFAREFNGKLRLSYAGGADAFNLKELFSLGIWPITAATTVLKPGGYQRFTQMGEILADCPFRPFTGVDVSGIEALALSARRDPRRRKPAKPLPRRKLNEKVPLLDCFTAPCKGGCPIQQDIPEYIALCQKGDYAAALKVITDKNPLPFITGTICAHRCQDKCTRNFYERPVQIRETKLLAAERGYGAFMAGLRRPMKLADLLPPRYQGWRCAAVIGGGPAGMSAAYFLARSGVPVTLYEKADALGGVVRQVIPSFRISDEAVEKDAELLRRMDADLRLGTPAPSLAELRAQGYEYVFLSVGAWKPGKLDLSGNVVPALEWLRDLKAGKSVPLGNVAVVGGGNTAMDAARAALRAGADSASIVYRRTRKYMPAEEEELEEALSEGVRFVELASPVEQRDGKLFCKKMRLGAPDASGRRRPEDTGERIEIPCDTVIAAVGEQIDGDLLSRYGVALDEKGRPPFRTDADGIAVFCGGDALRGPSTVVEAIADGRRFASETVQDVVKRLNIVVSSAGTTSAGTVSTETAPAGTVSAGTAPAVNVSSFTGSASALLDAAAAIAKKGILRDSARCEGERCLQCNAVCQVCADVCPNRANTVIVLPDGRRQILHIDRLCNECGNCAAFCPYDSAPWRDKFTLFRTLEDFRASPRNQGFLPLDGRRVMVRLCRDGVVSVYTADLNEDNPLPPDVEAFILTVLDQYAYLLWG